MPPTPIFRLARKSRLSTVQTMNAIHPAPTHAAPSARNRRPAPRTEPRNRHSQGESGRADRNTTYDPMCPGGTLPAAPDFSAMEGALRDASAHARHAIFPLLTMLKLYRSVATLARALMRARTDAGLSHGLGDDLVAMLDAARDATCVYFPDPAIPVMDAIAIHRAVVSLAAVAHRARAGRRNAVSAAPVQGLDDTGTDETPADPPPSYDAIEPDGPHCAWFRDHTAERDQRAYELLRTVIEERVYTKVKAANQRERDEREALESCPPPAPVSPPLPPA